MIFGIDFDGTFAADPPLFRAFVGLLREAGHRAVIVTGRKDAVMLSDPGRHWGDELRAVVGGLLPIVFAGHEWKKEAAAKAGYAVDVWIDDHPEWIGPQTVAGEPR